MKRFSYVARNASGAKSASTLDAPDREAAFREIKRLGLVPLSVAECAGPRQQSQSRQLGVRSAVLTSVACVISAVVWVLLPEKQVPPKEALATKKLKSPTAPAPKTTAPPSPVNKARIPLSAAAPAETPSPPSLPDITSAPLSDPPSTNRPLTPEEVLAKEKEDEILRPFTRSATEQLIALLGLPGQEVPPLPPILEDETLEADFQRALKHVIVLLDDDDDMTAAKKEHVAWVKQFIKEGQALGWTPAEYIRALELKRKEESDKRRAAQQILQEVAEKQPENEKAVRAALDKELSDEGLLSLDPPPPPDE